MKKPRCTNKSSHEIRLCIHYGLNLKSETCIDSSAFSFCRSAHIMHGSVLAVGGGSRDGLRRACEPDCLETQFWGDLS